MDSNELNLIVLSLTNNYKQIISRDELKNHPKLDWGNNGIGDRWAYKKFNYTLIRKNGTTTTYSENDNEFVDKNIVEKFIENNQNNQNRTIGVFVHSKRLNIQKRPIRPDIQKQICSLNCVVCTTNSDIACDHKNDLYNDERVLNIKTQTINDFQPLCRHCNLRKRQISKDELSNNKLYTSKDIPSFKTYSKLFPYGFPFEMKAFDIKDINLKVDTYWYDPIEFNNKVSQYIMYTLPIINELKKCRKQRKKRLFSDYLRFIGKMMILLKDVKEFTERSIELVMIAERLHGPKLPIELKKSIESISSFVRERDLMEDEEKHSIWINELYKKRIISEKRMMDDYLRRENEWRRQESKKPSEINQIYIWNKEREEREKNKNKYRMATNQLYGFFY